jgi:hypothetical protein
VITIKIPKGKFCLNKKAECCPFLRDDEAMTVCTFFDEELITDEKDTDPTKCGACKKLKTSCTIRLEKK